MIFVRIIILLFLFSGNLKASEFSSREVFNKLLKGFYKNEIHKCNYVNKSWSTGFEQYPYGMVLNSSAFKSILVFNNRNVVGTLWPNIGEISLERGVRKYQLGKKNKNSLFREKSLKNLKLLRKPCWVSLGGRGGIGMATSKDLY